MDHTTRITALFDDVRQTERVLGAEFLIRLIIVIVATLCAWLFLDFDFLPLWVCAYYTCVLLEKLVLNIQFSHYGRRALAVLWGISFLIASVYAVLPVYVWHMGDSIWKFGVVVLFTGGVLNIFLLRARNWVLGLAYLLPMTAAAFAIGGSFYQSPKGGMEFWTAMVLCVCLAIYFWVCLWEAHKAHQNLRHTREQFMQAQKVEALGTLTSGVAHDFNNLLSVVQGNLELLQAYPDAPDRDEFLEEALKAAKRGATLTRQLTSYGRKADLMPTRINPEETLRAVEEMANRVLPANITLTIHANSSDSVLFVDESLLHSALLNLVINARDAMPNGGAIALRCTDPAHPPQGLRLTAAKAYVGFEVSDTGSGIPEDVLPNVLDPFFSTKPLGQGSGLGLPMVYGFAQQSGGDISLDSTVGVGTSVTIYLPKGAGRT